MGYRACLGLLALARKYGENRLEAACERTISLGELSRRSVLSILQNGLDQQPLPHKPKPSDWVSPEHEHLRGATYYQ